MSGMDCLKCTELLRPFFPPAADIQSIETLEGITLFVCWKLGSDPGRPNKRSKEIRLHISRETIDDYAGAPFGVRSRIELRMVANLRMALKTFSPEHASAPWERVPIIDWHL